VYVVSTSLRTVRTVPLVETSAYRRLVDLGTLGGSGANAFAINKRAPVIGTRGGQNDVIARPSQAGTVSRPLGARGILDARKEGARSGRGPSGGRGGLCR